MDTMGSLAAEVTRWLRGDLIDTDGQQQIRDSLNDAMESLWIGMMQATVARLVGANSPATFSLASGAERVQLASVPDPLTSIGIVSTMAGGALPQREGNFAYTLVTESGSETNMSPASGQQLCAANNLFQLPVSAGLPAPVSGAFGWNLYAQMQVVGGFLDAGFALQNQQPLPFGVTINEPPSGWIGYPTNQQLPPIANTTGDNIAYIQHLEVVLSDTTKRAWDQFGIDSTIMRKMAATISSSSEYQPYVWDLLNGTTMEMRPVAGMTFNPRYWYVAKPRRIRYDQADIPYGNIAGTHEYLRSKALELCKLSLEEYVATDAWATRAATALAAIQQALLQENWSKEQKVAPYML